MGQVPAALHKMLLSLDRSDKPDKPYLIGVFGQGGSLALPTQLSADRDVDRLSAGTSPHVLHAADTHQPAKF